MCYINPKVDFAFKKLFGSEENKDLLMSLINAIVSETDQVVELELKNPYNLAAYQAGKMSILDINACDKTGRWFNVEMQIGEDLHFDKRAIYYWAKLVTEQLSEGMVFKALQKTISINILDFNFLASDNIFHNCYKITNVTTGKEDDKFHDMFELHYLELRKFDKSFEQVNNTLERWVSFLSQAHKLDKNNLPPSFAGDKAILKAIQAVDRMFNEEERRVYEVRRQSLMEVESKISSAEEKGWHRGLEQGLEQGTQQAQRITVLRAYEQGLAIATIASITGLNPVDIEAILKQADVSD